MSSPVRSWIAVGVLVIVGSAAVRPAVAQTAPAPAPAPPYPAPPPGYPPPGYAPPGYAATGYAPYPPYPGYPPPRLTQVHRARRGLVTGGAVTFGVTWGIAATLSLLLNCSGSSDCSDVVDYLWIPVAGPAVVAARTSGDGDTFLYMWSAGQAAGVVMLVAGLIGHDVMEYRMARGGPTLQLAPLFARDANGLALTARW